LKGLMDDFIVNYRTKNAIVHLKNWSILATTLVMGDCVIQGLTNYSCGAFIDVFSYKISKWKKTHVSMSKIMQVFKCKFKKKMSFYQVETYSLLCNLPIPYIRNPRDCDFNHNNDVLLRPPNKEIFKSSKRTPSYLYTTRERGVLSIVLVV